MTQERQLHVPRRRLPTGRLERLQRSAAAALARRAAQPIGDETEDHRYEQIQAEIDSLAYEALVEGQRAEPDTAADSTLTVAWPFAPGLTAPPASSAPVEPREPWRPEGEGNGREAAVAERFEAQLRAWTEQPSAPDEPIDPVCPSDIVNQVLTQGLRQYIARNGGRSKNRSAKVVYKDGSQARDLPLRSVSMGSELPDDGRLSLKVTLLSVRHMDMDAHVDGAWLRNREVSLRRPAAQTDELVYQQSRRQLAELSAAGPLILHMFQTGLEPAILGFYRALADHHIEGSGHTVAVQPHYFRGRDRFATGRPPWVVTE